MPIAHAHTLDAFSAAPTVEHLLGAWSADPLLLPIALVVFFYLRGWRRCRARYGGPWLSPWRALCFLSGSALLALGLASPLDALAGVSFSAHMLQHMLIMLISAPLLHLGAPFLPCFRGFPRVLRRYVFIPLARFVPLRALLRLLTQPLPAWILFEASLICWHFPGLYNLALRQNWVHDLQHFSFAFGAFFFWWNLIAPPPFRTRMHPLLGCILLALSSVVNSALSAVIVFAERPLYAYAEIAGTLPWSVLTDQQLGGSLMWTMGTMLHLAAILTLFAVYAHGETLREPRIEPAAVG